MRSVKMVSLLQNTHRRFQKRDIDVSDFANFHGDELTDQNSGSLAAACSNAIAVSHLEHVNEKSIRDMASNKIVGVALPSTAFLLR